MSDHVLKPPFAVTEAVSKVYFYYNGLPSKPPLIATTKPDPFQEPIGPEAYFVLKELRELGDHPLASAWDHDLADRSLPARLSSGLIGVEFGALSFKEGSVVALHCRTLIDNHNIHDYHV